MLLGRSKVLTSEQQIAAVFSHPTLYRIAAVVPHRRPVGRPALHPAWALLGYGILIRIYRSGARTQTQLAMPGVWPWILDLAAEVRAHHPDLHIEPGNPHRPPDWAAWKNARNRYFTDPDLLNAMREAHTHTAIDLAHHFGLLNPQGPGSLCHPDPTRVVYGDGTVIRPMYRPPAATRTLDKTTGEVTITYLDDHGRPIDRPARRYDPDAAEHHGHTGSVHGQNYVALHVRGQRPHHRVVLAVDRVPRPGLEADTSIALYRTIHPHLAGGPQAFVYDGAIRGTHIDQLMTECGVIVINKVHGSSRNPTDRQPPNPHTSRDQTRSSSSGSGSSQANSGATTPGRRPRNPTARRKTPRWFNLGTWEHDTPTGACHHHLTAADGAVHEFTLADDGTPTLLARLERKQVKRPRRSTGRYHFNIGYEIPCPHGAFLAWVTPHADPTDTEHRRADAVRVIADGEPDFATLYGLRNDSESFNNQLKRTLLVDRAMSLGGRRQLLDVLCFAILNNTTNAWRAVHHRELSGATRTGPEPASGPSTAA